MSKKSLDCLKVSIDFRDRFEELLFASGCKKSELAKRIGVGNDILIRAVMSE